MNESMWGVDDEGQKKSMEICLLGILDNGNEINRSMANSIRTAVFTV